MISYTARESQAEKWASEDAFPFRDGESNTGALRRVVAYGSTPLAVNLGHPKFTAARFVV